MDNQEEQLVEEALILVRKDRFEPSDETHRALVEFASRSYQHKAAVDHARRFCGLTGHVRRRPRSLRKRVIYHAHLYWVRLTEPQSIVMGSVILATLAVGLYSISIDSSLQPQRSVAEPQIDLPLTHTTGISEDKKIELEDGSVAWLGWHTEMEVQFTAGERIVRLKRGVAAFEVKPNPARPFIVTSDQVTTRVIGTEFVVNRQHDREVQVAVLEGQVSVIDAGGVRSEIAKAQMVKVNQGIAGPVVSRPINEMGRWREGVLVFENRPLLDALTSLEPYTRFELDTSLIADHDGTVTGMFFVDQAEVGLLSILTSHRINFDQSDNLLTLRKSSF